MSLIKSLTALAAGIAGNRLPLRRGQAGTRHLDALMAPAVIPAFTLGTLPDATIYTRQMLVITDGNAGNPCLAVSDGTTWGKITPIASPVFSGTVTIPTEVGTIQALAAAGAVDITSRVTTVASAGAIALTLADGANTQRKTISMIAHAGDAQLTPAHFAGGSTITFTAVGQSVELIFVGGKWAILSNNGATVA